MTKQIIFVTGNEMKVRHANEALIGTDFEFVAQKLDIIEPRAEDPKDVVIEKALQAIKLPSLRICNLKRFSPLKSSARTSGPHFVPTRQVGDWSG